MNIGQICWLREVLVTDRNGEAAITMEFSCDSGAGRTPRFFPVPTADLAQMRALYKEWGGSRAEGYRIGTTAQGPSIPIARSIRLWREYGNH